MAVLVALVAHFAGMSLTLEGRNKIRIIRIIRIIFLLFLPEVVRSSLKFLAAKISRDHRNRAVIQFAQAKPSASQRESSETNARGLLRYPVKSLTAMAARYDFSLSSR